MGVLDAVLQYKANEQAQQKAQSDSILQATQLFQQARQQATVNQMAQQLQGAQIANYQSEALKNAQSVTMQQQQNDILNKALNGGTTGSPGGFGVKSIKIGDVTLEKPEAPLNNGVPINGIDSIQDPSMKGLVQGVLDYRIDPSKSTSLRSDQRQRLIETAAAVDPTYDQTQFPLRSQFKKEITSGTTGKNIVALNTAIGHLDSLSNAFRELDKTRSNMLGPDIPIVNKVKDAILTGTGSQASTNVGTVGTALANELERAFKGSQTSMTGVEDFKNKLKGELSVDQQEGLKKTVADLLSSRINAIDEQHKSIMGKPRDFSLINDKSKQILTKLGIDPSTIDPVSTGQVKQLDANTAKQILLQAGGDKNKAREIARKQGYQL